MLPCKGIKCIKGKCIFWQIFFNNTTKKEDGNCTFLWTNILLIEMIELLRKKY